MASQTECADPLHSLCDLRELSWPAPSAPNHAHQKGEAGKAPALKCRPTWRGWPTEELRFPLHLLPLGESGDGGLGGAQGKMEKRTVVSTQKHAHV